MLPSFPLFQQPDRPIGDVCEECELVETKPGRLIQLAEGVQAQDLGPAIRRTIDLDDWHEAGATYAYPEALSPIEWACLKGLRRARATESRRVEQEQAKRIAEAETRSRLEQMAGR